MLFNSLPFLVFFALLWPTLRIAASARVSADRLVTLLLVASLVFYTLWFPPYLVLLLADVGINYLLLRRIADSRRPRLYLTLSLTLTLGLLAGFKYAAMFVETLLAARPLLPSGSTLFDGLQVPEVFLPLGISFYSFQICSLAIDTYRQRRPVPRLKHYVLYITFFPQLIAGPIVRGDELLPQLDRGPRFTATRSAVWLILIGLFKKVVCGDFLLAPFVDRVFDAPGVASAGFHAVALYAFAFQIYFDFSGYTDMARGFAKLLGFDLPENFAQPYLARSPSEFWRRWHMTLSRWLRDYLYIPLGGNRHGAWRTRIHLLVTMLIGGLWHGASWNFVVWGGLHGLLLIAARPFHRAGLDDGPVRAAHWPRIVLTFHAMVLPWIFFRAADWHDAIDFLGALTSGVGYTVLPAVPTLAVVFCAALHLAERWLTSRSERLKQWADRGPLTAFAEGAAMALLATLTFLCWDSGGQFIYFQF